MGQDRKEIMTWLLSQTRKLPDIDNLLEEKYDHNSPFYKVIMYILELEKKLGDK